MARFVANKDDKKLSLLIDLEAKMSREGIRRIVEAGAKAAIEDMKENIVKYRHVVHGEMRDAVGMAEYQETFGGARISVYPLGTDRRGVKNALKLYVMNYGIGHRKTKKGLQNKTGDYFITRNKVQTFAKVQAAMKAESEAIVKEVKNGGNQT